MWTSVVFKDHLTPEYPKKLLTIGNEKPKEQAQSYISCALRSIWPSCACRYHPNPDLLRALREQRHRRAREFHGAIPARRFKDMRFTVRVHATSVAPPRYPPAKPMATRRRTRRINVHISVRNCHGLSPFAVSLREATVRLLTHR